ncbi:MAG: response regulator [Chloroherpetonaceae bacterium]
MHDDDSPDTPRKILIVDDEEDTHLLLKAALKDFPLNYFDAFDGESAIAQIDKMRYDMILLDVIMPNGSGGDFLQYVLDNAVNLPPIVIITSLCNASFTRNALSLGVAEVLQKPVQPDDLRQIVRKYLFPHFQP